MIDDKMDLIKERLLDELISRMGDAEASRIKPGGLGVTVEAKDKEGLKDGLEKAKDVVNEAPAPHAGEHAGEDDDISRLAELAGHDDDEDVI